MHNLGLFFYSLMGSWLVWAGGILRVIPFFESLVEPYLRKIPRVSRFLDARGASLKRDLKIIALICLFVGCYRAWVFEHKNAEAAMYGPGGKSEAWGAYNTCDKERAVKTVLADSFSSQISQQIGQINSQQDTFNRCILALGQKNVAEPLKFDVLTWKLNVLHSENGEQERLWAVIVIANKTVSPVRGTFSCDAEFKSLSSTLLSHGNSLRADYEQKTSKSVHVEYLYPPLSPQNPLVFSAYTPEGKEFSSCSFKSD
jgi:hypothetical protein